MNRMSSPPIVSLENRAVVVTGAGQGVGKAIVELGIELGANIVAADPNGATPSAALEPLPKDRVLPVVGSVVDADLAARAVADAVGRFGARSARSTAPRPRPACSASR